MKIKKLLFLAALGLTATATLTSCDNIVGEEDNPAPAVPSSVVEDARVLGAALEAGATVSVTYSIAGTQYVATFQKNADDTYTLISNTAAASGSRAGTRTSGPDYTVPTGDAAAGKITLELVGDKLVLTVNAANGAPIFEAQMTVDGGEVTVLNTNGNGLDCTIGSVSVGDQSKAIWNPVLETVNIEENNGLSYAVKYSEGDTWAEVVERYKDFDLVEITETEDGYISVKFSKEFVVARLKAAGDDDEQAEGTYEASYSVTFYLTTTDPNSLVAGSRAGTRQVAAPTFITPADEVGDASTYYLVAAPRALAEAVSGDLGKLVGADGKIYNTKDDAAAFGTTAVAMIAYLGDKNGIDGQSAYSATYNHGLAIALADESGSSNWENAKTACSTTKTTSTPVTGASWMLPSQDQWKAMFKANGGSESSYTDLNTAIGNAGGTALQEYLYWSSTELDVDFAYFVYLLEGLARFRDGHKGLENLVRACLAF